VSIDFVFIIDIVVNCRTAYLTAHGLLEKRPRQIARHYLLSWFVVDVSASIPVDLILLANQAFMEDDGSEERNSYRMTKLIKALRLMRLLRLVRLVKLARVIKIAQEQLQINPFVLQLVKLCFKMSFLIHLSACAWHWSASFDLPEDSPFACQARAAAGQQTCFDERVTMAMATWLQYFEASHFSNGEWPTTLEAYTAAIYWAITTVATIGYGDIKSISNLERYMSMVIMLSGSIVFGVVVGGMSDSLDQMNSVRARRTRKMDYVRAMLRERNVPHALIIRTKHYYERYLLECGDVLTEQKILSELPPPLRTELLLCLNLRTVESITFFHGQDSTFIISVCKMLKPCYFAPLDWIFKEGDLGLEMYFVQLGSVNVICFLDGEEVILETLETGAYFGEVAVMLDGVRREASVRAVSFCSMFSFTKENLNRLLQMYPDVMQKMQTQMERRLRQYRLKRSIQSVKSANALSPDTPARFCQPNAMPSGEFRPQEPVRRQGSLAKVFPIMCSPSMLVRTSTTSIGEKEKHPSLEKLLKVLNNTNSIEQIEEKVRSRSSSHEDMLQPNLESSVAPAEAGGEGAEVGGAGATGTAGGDGQPPSVLISDLQDEDDMPPGWVRNPDGSLTKAA
jgi:CRP-like cAMP-binding protein